MLHNVTGQPEIPSSAQWHKGSWAASPLAILIPQASSQQLMSQNYISSGMQTPPPRQSPISWQRASPPVSSMLSGRGTQREGETTLIPGTDLGCDHLAWQILPLRLKWKDWIAYVFLILLPPVAGPEIACNPHLCHAPRISFSCIGSAPCVRAQRPRCSPGSSKACTDLLLCAHGTPEPHQEPRPAGNMWTAFHKKIDYILHQKLSQ